MSKKQALVPETPEPEQEPRQKITHGKRTLPVRLNDDELLEQARKMAEASEAAEAAEQARKQVTTQYKAEEEEARGKEKAARTLMRNGYEYRPVDITVTKDWDEKTVTIRRDDTGEIVEFREMNNSELQLEIPTAEPEKTIEEKRVEVQAEGEALVQELKEIVSA